MKLNNRGTSILEAVLLMITISLATLSLCETKYNAALAKKHDEYNMKFVNIVNNTYSIIFSCNDEINTLFKYYESIGIKGNMVLKEEIKRNGIVIRKVWETFIKLDEQLIQRDQITKGYSIKIKWYIFEEDYTEDRSRLIMIEPLKVLGRTAFEVYTSDTWSFIYET